ncbi:MAG TPA: S8 family serine peptidase, partial [Acidimicrobiales bacterium]|nr:S8 family serine peptidase [Acidimicrobiales bacterium]
MLRLPSAVSLEALSPSESWRDSTGKGVRVAVVDSGVEADHPDLEGCVDADGGVMVTLDEGGEPVLTSGRHDDAFGHGTACAGIIHRLAPEASITSVRVLGSGLAG